MIILFKLYVNRYILIDFYDLLMRSWSNSLRVTGEKRCVSNIFETAEQHHNSLQTNSTTTVGISSISEGLEIVINSLWVDSLDNRSFFEHYRVMNSLCS